MLGAALPPWQAHLTTSPTRTLPTWWIINISVARLASGHLRHPERVWYRDPLEESVRSGD
jgi:hypothetical protein